MDIDKTTLNTLKKWMGECAFDEFTGEEILKMIDEIEIRYEVNLCDTCENWFGKCTSNPKFGIGVGNDNVYECDMYNEVI